jgi:hypothetical protein
LLLVDKIWNLNLADALSKAYPDHVFYPWLFKRAPENWFDAPEQRRRFFDFVPRHLQYTPEGDLSHWYRIPVEEVVKLGGGRMLRRLFGMSLAAALTDVYPDHKWDSWRFNKAPDNHLQDLAQQRTLLDEIGRRLGITDMQQWYKIQKLQVVKNGGSGLIKMHKDSLQTALQKVYPDHKWLPWLFAKAPKGFWHSIDNQRRFFDWSMEQLNLKQMDDWYSTSKDELASLGGTGLLTHRYNDGLSEALRHIYPNHTWQPWRFRKCPQSFWQSLQNRKDYFQWLGNELGFTKMDDWYNLTNDIIREKNGGGLMTRFDFCFTCCSHHLRIQLTPFGFSRVYRCSVYRAMVEIFPDHSWVAQGFGKVGSISTPTT